MCTDKTNTTQQTHTKKGCITMTKRMETLERVKAYNDYAMKVNPHVIPTKGISSGTHGRAFEASVKVFFGNYRFSGIVAKAGKNDMIKKIDGTMASFEIKTGCGELATLDENGDIISTVFTKDYIVYCPEYDPSIPAEFQSYVLTADNFFDAVKSAGLIRRKKSSAMCKRPAELQYYDKLAIQTFTNSNKKYDCFLEMLEFHGESLVKFIERHTINTK